MAKTPDFSACIPNYNYDRYLGITMESILGQSHDSLELIVADNCSTDNSVEVVRSFDDKRVHLVENRTNVGFARNLDKAAQHARGRHVMTISSDDVVNPEAFSTYAKVLDQVPDADRVVLCSGWNVIDSDGKLARVKGLADTIFRSSDRKRDWESEGTPPIYAVDASELLERCLSTMKNPFMFVSVCFPRAAYQVLEGYGGARMMNPDKWFNFRLLGEIDTAIFVDAPLFSYRWHDQNQTAQQESHGALKYLVDEYSTTLEMPANLLDKAGLTPKDVVEAFIEHDIARHGWATLARGQNRKASRIWDFGNACYPDVMKRNKKAQLLRAALMTGSVGGRMAKIAHRVVQSR